MIGMALGQILGGPVSDRMGRKVPLFIGMGGFTIASAVCAVCTNIYVFLVFRFIMGLSGAFGIVISRAIARDVCEGPELMRFMAILMMVNGLAPIAAPVLGGQILLFTSWHGIFFVLTAVGIIQIMATMAYKETLKKTDRVRRFSDGFKAFGTLVKNRYFFGHCLVQCFVFGAFFSYIAGSSFLFQNIYHVTPQQYSYIFGGIGVGLMLIGALPARLAGTVREVVMLKYSILIPLIGSLFLLAGIIMKAPIWYTIPVLFVTIVPLSVMGAASVSLALSRCGENAGSGSAADRFFLHDSWRCHDAGRRHCRGSDGASDGHHHGRLLCAGCHHVLHKDCAGACQRDEIGEISCILRETQKRKEKFKIKRIQNFHLKKIQADKNIFSVLYLFSSFHSIL